MKRTLVAVAIATVFVLALAMPAFAQITFTPFSTMNYNATYEWDGNVTVFDRAAETHAGVYVQEIRGEGKMTKNTTIAMVPYKTTVEDNNNFVTSPTAVVNLRVSSKIDLSSPGWYLYEGALVLPSALYTVYGTPSLAVFAPPAAPAGAPIDYTGMTAANWGAQLVHRQRWAVQVEPDPGYSGRLDQDFELANGPYIGTSAEMMESMDFFRGRNTAPVLHNIGWEWDWTLARKYRSYSLYVGNYFEIDQYARTSMGDLRRYINIASPWSMSYLYEDFRVVGASEVREDFNMMNIPAGPYPPLPTTGPAVWHDAFI